MSAESRMALLRTRYSKLLGRGTNIDELATELQRRDFLSASEKDTITSSLSAVRKHRELCKALATRGASEVGTLSKVIAEFQETSKPSPLTTKETTQPSLSALKESEKVSQQRNVEYVTCKKPPPKQEGETSKVQHGDMGSSSCHSEETEGSSKHGDHVFNENEGKGNRLQQYGRCNGGASSQSQGSGGHHQHTIQSKQQIRDVPDPPGLPVLSMSSSESDSDSSSSDSECDSDHTEVEQVTGNQMEAFVVLLYMMVTQLVQALESCRNSSQRSRDNYDEDDDEFETTSHPSKTDRHGDLADTQHGRSTTDKTLANGQDDPSVTTSQLNWLKVDVPLEEIRDFFPPEDIKGVTPNSLSPINLNLSVILEAFQQFFERFQQATKESISQNAQLVKDLKKKHARLQTKVKLLQSSSVVETAAEHKQHHVPSHSDSHNQVQRLQKELSRLLEKMKVVEPFQTAYAKSEERCKQLVGVTQEWAIECEEKDKLIAVLETQIKQHQEEIDQLQKRVFKYKKHWMETREKDEAVGNGGCGAKVDPSQLEEAKLELALRREFQDQVLAEKEEAVETARRVTLENELLKRDNDQLRDDIEELRDRMGNLKVNAQAKEPSVREMSVLSSENRQLKEKIEQLEKQTTSLSDEVLAYKTYVNELTQAPLDGVGGVQQPSTRPQRPPPRQTARTQAMVTGYSVPNPLRKEAAKRRQQQKPHPSGSVATVISRGVPPPPVTDDLIIEPHDHHHDDGCHDNDDADTVSTISDEDDLSPLTSHTNGHAPRLVNGDIPGHYLTDPSRDCPPLPVDFTDCPPSVGDFQSFDPAISPSSHISTSSSSTRDYTQHIRYPNHSGILVRPLCDDEVSLQGEGVEFSSSEQNPPNFYDPTILSPAKFGGARAHTPNQPEAVLLPGSALLAPEPLRGRKCPKCHHVWLTLGEREFQSHVAGCFK